ncbi:hypothetical protein, partial [Alloprevotella tannerae]|uniref:hypothetical protein n=1 Tax=Alloprevotella tannerae TaxID=76122 RepID=UPI00360B408B
MSANRRVNTQINPNHQSSLPHHKPLGLVFWQGRRWSEATTLPRCAAKCNPLGLVFQIIRISAYNQAVIARFVVASLLENVQGRLKAWRFTDGKWQEVELPRLPSGA